MNKKLKKLLFRIICSALIFVLALIFCKNDNFKLPTFLIAYLIISYDILKKSLKNIKNGEVFDENFLMMIATFGAFALKEYTEAVAIMLFYQIGEFFQSYAVNRSRKSISDLMDIRPDYANIEINGKIEKVNPNNINIGDIIIVKPSEKVPLDGVIVEGESSLNTSAITGESLPKDVESGDDILSGSINLTGLLKIKVSKKFTESTASKILNLVENATTRKANVENFIKKFAKYYTPIVVCTAFIIAIFPPLIISKEMFSTWFYRAIIFLVLSCPCALVISIPLSFFGGLGACSKHGILIKGSNFLEALVNVKYFVFDKTGTITKGNFKVEKVESFFIPKEELLEITAYSEAYSHHPIAESIKSEYGKEINLNKIKNVSDLQGFGVKAEINNNEIYVGNSKLMKKINIDIDPINEIGTIVYIVINKKYSGYIIINDEVKDSAYETIKKLYEIGIKKIVILTGDKKEVANNIAQKVCIKDICSELLPTDKVEKIEELLHKKDQNEKLAFVGDGINDAPVLARADIGIAMGGIGSDSAIEASDVVIMNDDLTRIPKAIEISKKTLNIAKQNIIFAIGIKIIVLISGALGYTSIWMAIFADVGVSIIAILNSIRALYI